MVYSRVVLLFVSVISTVLCHVSEEFLSHSKRVSITAFPCEHPQRRAIYLKELVSGEDWKNQYQNIIKNIQPFATTLDRCEGSGCCKLYNERCKPLEENEVTLTFAILDGREKTFTVRAMNHTRCSCQKINDKLIKKK